MCCVQQCALFSCEGGFTIVVLCRIVFCFAESGSVVQNCVVVQQL